MLGWELARGGVEPKVRSERSWKGRELWAALARNSSSNVSTKESTRFCSTLYEVQIRYLLAFLNIKTRAERFVAYGSTFQIDYTLLVIGLIVSILLSILLSFFCCLLCNGCWLHRRRNPQMYESVHESGWYPLCCGLGIPMGTVVFSTHPPQYRDDNEMYHGSSTSSLPSSKQRVRFNPDGTPRGPLKPNFFTWKPIPDIPTKLFG
ncbi:unnamed protein product [Cylicocyclus nassatus]|uniref:Uncharacterized protein n=1 Tax=Cylicocyclus nassatus TaxID=53992 RepID=A0AA36GDW7_CYLNA|nr:unnamed protein product [Cylicocyclus nassatus]